MSSPAPPSRPAKKFKWERLLEAERQRLGLLAALPPTPQATPTQLPLPDPTPEPEMEREEEPEQDPVFQLAMHLRTPPAQEPAFQLQSPAQLEPAQLQPAPLLLGSLPEPQAPLPLAYYSGPAGGVGDFSQVAWPYDFYPPPSPYGPFGGYGGFGPY